MSAYEDDDTDGDLDPFDAMTEREQVRFLAAGTPRPDEDDPLIGLMLTVLGEVGLASGVTGDALAVGDPDLARTVADALLAEHIAESVTLQPAWRSAARQVLGTEHIIVRPLADRNAQVRQLVDVIAGGIAHMLARQAAQHIAESRG